MNLKQQILWIGRRMEKEMEILRENERAA